MPFIARKDPETFQGALETILSGTRLINCLIYLYENIVLSATDKQQMEEVEESIKLLRNSGVTLKQNKFASRKKQGDYLCQMILLIKSNYRRGRQ